MTDDSETSEFSVDGKMILILVGMMGSLIECLQENGALKPGQYEAALRKAAAPSDDRFSKTIYEIMLKALAQGGSVDEGQKH
jgi:hypothetical protein